MKFIKENLYLILIIMVNIAFISLVIKDGHNWGGDFSLYIAQAKSINNLTVRELYELNKYSMQNSMVEIGPYLYPQGFPLLLSPIYSFFGIHFIIMKAFCAAFLVLSLPLIFKLFNPYFPKKIYAIILVAFIATSADFITFTDSILSDLPFFFFCMVTFSFIQSKNTLLNQVILGLSMGFSYLIRDIGIVFIPTLLAYQINSYFMQKPTSKKLLFNTVPYLFFCIIFITNFFLFPKGGENHFSMLIKQFSLELILNNVLYYNDLLFNFLHVSKLPVYLIAILIILGIFSIWKQQIHFFIFVLFYFLVLFVWPPQGIRFIFPLLPIFIFFLIKGAIFVCENFKLNQKYLPLLLLVYLGLITYPNLNQIIKYSQSETNEAYTPEMINMYDFIKKNVPKNEIIGFKKPGVLRLFSDRNAILTDNYHFSDSKASYLLLNKTEYEGQITAYKKIHETNHYILIQKRKLLSQH